MLIGEVDTATINTGDPKASLIGIIGGGANRDMGDTLSNLISFFVMAT